MRMEELLSAADEMENKRSDRRGASDDLSTSSPMDIIANHASSSHPLPLHPLPLPPLTENKNNNNNYTNNNTTTTATTTSTSTNNKTKSPIESPRNSSIRTRSKRDSLPPPLTIDPDTDNLPPSSSTPSSSSSTTSTTSSRAAPVPQCKTPGCVVCLKGPPASFDKGTPIWAQILHLVLYALTESAKVHVMGSPKMKVKRYFHLRDDIYEYISIHWDVICRRERIKNWRHTIGMTLSHYQNLFQNGYHIYQNTGYWSMKDNVPSPYAIDQLIGEGTSPGKKRKYSHPKSGSTPSEKDKDATMTSYISDFPISPMPGSSPSMGTTTTTTTTTTNSNDENEKNESHNPGDENLSKPSPSTMPHFNNPSSTLPSPQSLVPNSAVRFDEMKGEIDRFKKEMGVLQSEINALQEQLQVKKAEEHLLKFLQEGISSFRDKIKQRIELLRTEMINNHSEHQQQIHTMASELTQLREIGADLRNAFQYQFTRLAHLNASHLQI